MKKLFIVMLSLLITSAVYAHPRDRWKNFFNDKLDNTPANQAAFCQYLGYTGMAIKNLDISANYRGNSNMNGLRFWLSDGFSYSPVIDGKQEAINTSENDGGCANDSLDTFWAQNLPWKSNPQNVPVAQGGSHTTGGTVTYPHFVANGWWNNTCTSQIVWNFQNEAIMKDGVERVISHIKNVMDVSNNFLPGGLMMDEPALSGDFNRWNASTSKNVGVDLGYWTQISDSGFAHGTVTMTYNSFSDGHAEYYKYLRKRMREEFGNEGCRLVFHPFDPYEANYSWPGNIISAGWIKGQHEAGITQPGTRTDVLETSPDMLFQEREEVNPEIIQNGVYNYGHLRYTFNDVGVSIPHRDDFVYESMARECFIDVAKVGAWTNFFNRLSQGTGWGGALNTLPAWMKFYRCVANWDNLNDVPTANRSEYTQFGTTTYHSEYQGLHSHLGVHAAYANDYRYAYTDYPRVVAVYRGTQTETAQGSVTVSFDYVLDAVTELDGWFATGTARLANFTVTEDFPNRKKYITTNLTVNTNGTAFRLFFHKKPYVDRINSSGVTKNSVSSQGNTMTMIKYTQ